MPPWLLLAMVMLLTACPRSTPPARLGISGPMGSQIATWIPGDAEVAVAVDGASAGDLDALIAAMGLGDVGALGAMGARETHAWRVAGLEPRGGIWMVLDLEGEVSARCAYIGSIDDEAAAAAALVAAGGVERAADGARLVELDGVITVIEDDVACSVQGGARSRVERHALRLAGLRAGERLVDQEVARALLERVPMSPMVVWTRGETVDALLAGGGLPVGLIDTAAPAAIAVAVDASGHATLTIRAPAGAIEPPAEPVPLAFGTLAADGPALTVLRAAPEPHVDENPDVPASAEYQAALAAFDAKLAEAVAIVDKVRALDTAARTAWLQTWGIASATISPFDRQLEIEIAWQAPAWPPADLRAAADRAATQARAGATVLLAELDGALVELAKQREALMKLRARDVAAWDRAQRTP